MNHYCNTIHINSMVVKVMIVLLTGSSLKIEVKQVKRVKQLMCLCRNILVSINLLEVGAMNLEMFWNSQDVEV